MEITPKKTGAKEKGRKDRVDWVSFVGPQFLGSLWNDIRQDFKEFKREKRGKPRLKWKRTKKGGNELCKNDGDTDV